MQFFKIVGVPLAILIELLSVTLFPLFIFIVVFLGKCIPLKIWQNSSINIIEAIARSWAHLNYFIFRYLLQVKMEITGLEQVKPKQNYFVIANHQSWIDILVLEITLRGRTGFSRYFIKKNLLHIPLAGWVCRIFDYPYMYRFGKSHLAKHPEDKGKDVLITKRSCEKLKGSYYKLNNFPEGTRFTKAKHDAQQSPYRYLLKPKSAGVAYALAILHDDLQGIINITIHYEKSPNIIKLFMGGGGKIKVQVEVLPILPDIIGDYADDNAFRVHFQAWLSDIWRKKDALLHVRLL